jgi:hypothetical protein
MDAEQLEFQSFLDKLNSPTALESFPDEHLGLVAKYSHERLSSVVFPAPFLVDR